MPTFNPATPITAPPEGYQWYFAYGSNNSYEQLLRRLGNIGPHFFDGKEEEKTSASPQVIFGGAHNQSTDINIYPPLAIKVVLLPSYYFVIDAPSATKGLGYANLRKGFGCTVAHPKAASSNHQEGSGEVFDPYPLLARHEHDDAKRSTELLNRPPFVVSVAYLLSNAQLLMMDRFENAPDKYHRESVKGLVLKTIDPMPTWEKRGGEEDVSPTTAAATVDANAQLLSPSAVAPPNVAATNAMVHVTRDPHQRDAIIARVRREAQQLEDELTTYFASASESSSTFSSSSLEHQRFRREEFYQRLVAQFASSDSTEAIEGVAYIYEGNGLLHTDVVEEDDDGNGNKKGAAASAHSEVPPLATAVAVAEVGGATQPSSSYMGRILEGEYFFELLGGDSAEGADGEHYALSNKLLAAYMSYLHSIEMSSIPSPRTLLRQAGKV